MTGDASASPETSAAKILSRHFPTFERALEAHRWRRVVRWRNEGESFEFLKQLETEWAQDVAQGEAGSNCRNRLLKHRQDFRRIIGRGHPAAIKLYLTNCPDEMVPLAVWLWGRCVDRFRLFGLAEYCHHPSPEVRSHVAKALRRLEAWSLLREMAAAYPDDAKVNWYATTPTMQRPFAERLHDFKLGVDDSHAGEVVTPSQMPFWAQETFWSSTPPKSVLLIRPMLRRIRHWVRWGVN